MEEKAAAAVAATAAAESPAWEWEAAKQSGSEQHAGRPPAGREGDGRNYASPSTSPPPPPAPALLPFLASPPHPRASSIPPSRLPLHLVTPHGPGPNTLAPRLPPPGRALATNPNPISSPARRRRAAGQSSAHSVRGA